MSFSVLHISDLHRDLKDEIRNDWLLQSLDTDFQQFQKSTPPISEPTICIVSGDLVYGVRAGDDGAKAELERQYAQAEEFLIGLADRWFEGDRERVVLIPGNHDVSYDQVMKSAVKVVTPDASSERASLVRELFNPNSTLRWSWSELCFYRIWDQAGYERRLQHFASTYERFYQGKRLYPLNSEKQSDIFDFPDLRFCVAALNSCFNNDPLRRGGAFHPVAVAEICRLLREPKRAGWLSAATWHHNLAGGPGADDFLDVQFLQILIDAGASLGFHGHQHLPECFDERYRIGPSRRKMTVISASTLCAEPNNLKPGFPRSYNIVEIDADQRTGRVHQRQMVNQLFALPIWGPGHFTSTGSSYVDFDLCGPLQERPVERDNQLLLGLIDEQIGGRNFGEALKSLRRAAHIPLARPYLVKVLEALDDARTTLAELWPPQTVPEAIFLGGAVLETGSTAEALAFVQLPVVSSSTDASLRHIINQITERRLK